MAETPPFDEGQPDAKAVATQSESHGLSIVRYHDGKSRMCMAY